MYDNGPPSLLNMSMQTYDNNNYPHDDYSHQETPKPFDLSQVTNEIPYYDLPAALMCLLVKVNLSPEREGESQRIGLFVLKG